MFLKEIKELSYLIKKTLLKDLKNSIKKILIAHSSNDNYGASKVLISTIDIFIKNGYDIHLLLPNKGPLNNNEIIKRTNLKIINLGVFRKKYFNIFGLINRLYFIIKSSLYIKSFLEKNQIDLVYTNTSTVISPSIAAKLVGKPSIHHIHEIPDTNYIYAKFVTTFLNNFSRNIICVSNSVTDFWIKAGLKKVKINTIPNGFNYKKIKQKNLNEKKIIFTSVSRIIPYKGHELLIRLFDVLCKKNNKIHLQIVGDTLNHYEKYLCKLKLNIKNRGLDDRITFMGFRKDITPILTKSNFFIHTPVSPDPFPTVIFEAIQSGTPVITNNLGGAYEILNNGKNGLIIENNLIQNSAEIILDYINKQRLQEENVKLAFDYVCKKFSFKEFRKKILNTIGE